MRRCSLDSVNTRENNMLLFAVFWMLFGALVGLSAANRKGFSPAAGVCQSGLPRILSPLMYLISAEKKKCPYCAEGIKKEASICPHCRKDLDADKYDDVKVCPSCHHEYPQEAATCVDCKRELVDAVRQA